MSAASSSLLTRSEVALGCAVVHHLTDRLKLSPEVASDAALCVLDEMMAVGNAALHDAMYREYREGVEHDETNEDYFSAAADANYWEVHEKQGDYALPQPLDQPQFARS